MRLKNITPLKVYIVRVLDHKFTKRLINAKELIALIILFATFGSRLFVHPELKITYGYVGFPKPLLAKSIDPKMYEDDPIYAFILSDGLLIVSIENKSSKTITNVELFIRGVVNFNTIGVQSTSAKLEQNQAKIFKFNRLQNNILSFPDFKEIPAMSFTTISIWGTFSESFLASQIELNSSTGAITVSRFEYIDSKMAQFVAKNQTLFLLIVSALLLLVVFYRLSKGV